MKSGAEKYNNLKEKSNGGIQKYLSSGAWMVTSAFS